MTVQQNHELDGPGQVFDVVVVGAGIAGISAAASLATAGLAVAVFESRDRVGGRLLAHRAGDGTALDLGATWFWPGETNIAELVTDLGTRTHDQHLAGDAMYHQPEGSQRIEGNPLDVTSSRFSDGADSVVEALAATLPDGTVQLGRPVIAIEALDDRLVLSTAAGAVAARHVVLAVPPALAVAKIDFAPSLPERLAGLASVTPVWMGGTTKVVVRFREAFWKEAGLSGSGISHCGPMRELHDMSGPDGHPAAIFGFVPATAANEPTVTADRVVEQLIELFGPAAADPLEVVIQDWRNEPWTSPPGVERLTAFQSFGHPLYSEPAMDGRLHWASTETAGYNPGHIEGALVAAKRAAAAIVANLAADSARLGNDDVTDG